MVQHTEIHRKLNLRRRLLAYSEPGTCYVPFCGDGDIAAALYAGSPILAVDIDADRTAEFKRRLPDATVVTADADEPLDSPDVEAPISVIDCDAYAYPYGAFRQVWQSPLPMTDRVVVFFTDSQLQRLKMRRDVRYFDGSVEKFSSTNKVRIILNYWWSRHCLPSLQAFVRCDVGRAHKYMRGGTLYWGVVLSGVRGARPWAER